jgi:hypothetical protein
MVVDVIDKERQKLMSSPMNYGVERLFRTWWRVYYIARVIVERCDDK